MAGKARSAATNLTASEIPLQEAYVKSVGQKKSIKYEQPEANVFPAC